MRKIKRMGKACTKACSACSKDRWTLIKVTGRTRICEQREIGFRCTTLKSQVWRGGWNWSEVSTLKEICLDAQIGVFSLKPQAIFVVGTYFWGPISAPADVVAQGQYLLHLYRWTPQEADVYFWSSWIHALCSVSDLFACGLSYSLSDPVVAMQGVTY